MFLPRYISINATGNIRKNFAIGRGHLDGMRYLEIFAFGVQVSFYNLAAGRRIVDSFNSKEAA